MSNQFPNSAQEIAKTMKWYHQGRWVNTARGFDPPDMHGVPVIDATHISDDMYEDAERVRLKAPAGTTPKFSVVDDIGGREVQPVFPAVVIGFETTTTITLLFASFAPEKEDGDEVLAMCTLSRIKSTGDFGGPLATAVVRSDENGRVNDMGVEFIDSLRGTGSIDGIDYAGIRTSTYFDFVLAVRALEIMSCSNVTIAVPTRSRPMARRIARTGVDVSEIHVTGTSKSYANRGDKRHIPLGDEPLHTVRGHFAEYGDAYGKGKLFGRLEGRYWVPSHARGSVSNGIREHVYITKGNNIV